VPNSVEEDTIEQIPANIIELAVDIVSAYVGRNSVPMAELPKLIEDIHLALMRIGPKTARIETVEPPKPAVSVKQSIKAGHLTCLEDGQHFKSMRGHLWAQHGMTPDQYREKWGLSADYPMVAPDYAKARSELARQFGFGEKRRGKQALAKES
jgi:predicted transcriptional regulator